MSEQLATRFMEALRTLGETRNVEPLAALYGENARIGNVVSPDEFHGPDGARKFWSEYRGTFETVTSTFRNVIAGEGRAALEWQTEGTSAQGTPLRYAGVTLLETDGDQVTRSAAYFDPSALGRQMTA